MYDVKTHNNMAMQRQSLRLIDLITHAILKQRPRDDQLEGARENDVQIPSAMSSSSPRNRSNDCTHFSKLHDLK